jgi:hypothetical protein
MQEGTGALEETYAVGESPYLSHEEWIRLGIEPTTVVTGTDVRTWCNGFNGKLDGITELQSKSDMRQAIFVDKCKI